MESYENAFEMRLLIVLSDETANIAIFSCFLFSKKLFNCLISFNSKYSHNNLCCFNSNYGWCSNDCSEKANSNYT